MGKIVVVDYDPEWPQTFEELCVPVRQALGDLVVAIEHVGSTSVPGQAAKPVIDIDIVVARGNVGRAIAALATIGYQHRGDLGIPTREAFRAPGGTPRHNLYVCPEGSPALANHLTLRNHLRENPDSVAAYAALKRRLAEEHDDVETYAEAKTEFITGILRRCGFAEDALDDIETMNRLDKP